MSSMPVEQTQGAGMALSNAIADAVERGAQRTVLVNGRRRLPLSGVLFAADLVLTASHGIEREEDLSVVMPDGSGQTASLAGRDRGFDLAVLKLASPSAGWLASPAASAARVGNLVVALGRPSSEGVQASFGMVISIGSGLRTQGGGMLEQYLMTDAAPYPGFSGGPLLDLSGSVLGINTSGLVRGTLLSLPARMAWEVAQTLAQHGHIRRGYLGIRSQVVELPRQSVDVLGRAQESGLLVVGIEGDGPAAAGLMVGDIVVAVDGAAVSDHDDLMARLTGDVVGRSVSLQVLRGGQVQLVSVLVGERA